MHCGAAYVDCGAAMHARDGHGDVNGVRVLSDGVDHFALACAAFATAVDEMLALANAMSGKQCIETHDVAFRPSITKFSGSVTNEQCRSQQEQFGLLRVELVSLCMAVCICGWLVHDGC